MSGTEKKEHAHPEKFVFPGFAISQLSNTFLYTYGTETDTTARGFYELEPLQIETGQAVFSQAAGYPPIPPVSILLQDDTLILNCPCAAPKNKLCTHQTQVLFNIMNRRELRIFFDKALRHEKIRSVAREYGLQETEDPDTWFEVQYRHKSIDVLPRVKEWIPYNRDTRQNLEKQLLPDDTTALPSGKKEENVRSLLVFGKHAYSDSPAVSLYEAAFTAAGKVKNPLREADPFEKATDTDEPAVLRFYNALSRLRNLPGTELSTTDLEAMRSAVRNAAGLETFFHDHRISENVSSASLSPVRVKLLPADVRLSVDIEEPFCRISGQLHIGDAVFELYALPLRYRHFLLLGTTLYFIDSPELLKIITFFRGGHAGILLHQSQFEDFRTNVLSRLENKVRIRYSFLKPATREQLEEKGFTEPVEKLLYLSESGKYVLLTPVMRYGHIEVPVLSRRQIYDTDYNGQAFSVPRDEFAEVAFISVLLRQYSGFEEQLNRDYLYLHKDRFLDESWFPDAFEDWRREGITVLGFGQLSNNKLNPNKVKIAVQVSSGIDWFLTRVNVSFGDKQVPLKQLHKAVRNRSRYIELDDGTRGILPEEWLQKMARFFDAGEISEEEIRTPHISFSGIAELYDEEMLTQETHSQLALYQSKLAGFENIRRSEVPAELQAQLRGYQQQGLDWLNFLDEMNFGGCLADDMGLGKTLQVIAFLLAQRSRTTHNVNLVVLPTSLLFNWQDELKRFAPTLKVYTQYGSKRIKDTRIFDEHEIILTTYGVLQSEIKIFKNYRFNYIVLDESQAIKNPESQRYKAVCMLQARNRLVLTGTPVENNTFDLYGQLSFACPGLLGSKAYFRDTYSIPIDKFKDRRRTQELQRKIHPFILRRTKEQVAAELPEKTEMVIYCEMEPEQRAVYDAYMQELRSLILGQSEEETAQSSMHVLQGLIKLRQICNSPATLNDEKYYGAASSKIDTLVEEIRNKAPEHKILVFSQFVSMLELIRERLEKEGIGFEYLTGETRNRAARVKRFSEDPEVRVFLISLKAGGTGLNLTQADYVYLVDPWWNPAVENQAIDRVHRIGQKNHVVAVRLICPDTVESRIMELQASKKELIDTLIKTDVSAAKSLTKEDLLALLG
ncbi:MAG: DEAD/DEAH box helicase [Flavobacteriales bacterium]